MLLENPGADRGRYGMLNRVPFPLRDSRVNTHLVFISSDVLSHHDAYRLVWTMSLWFIPIPVTVEGARSGLLGHDNADVHSRGILFGHASHDGK